MEAKQIKIEDYSYDLPENKIAKHPLAARDQSRLLVYKAGLLIDDQFTNIIDHLPANSLLFINDTRVIEARLSFQKPSGAHIEIFCLEPDSEYTNLADAMNARGSVKWKCLIGGASKWKPGQVLNQVLSIDGREIVLSATFLGKEQQSFLILLQWTNEEYSFEEIIKAAGSIPLPPYIKREVDAADSERYQTVYANQAGSVAAPTAGLHFTPEILTQLEKEGVRTQHLTLHVGAGTFKPVKSETVGDHEMHAERIDVSIHTIEELRTYDQRVSISVGTTSLRTLESLYWFGVIIMRTPEIKPDELYLEQWYPYEQDSTVTKQHALEKLLEWMKRNGLTRLMCKTSILIAPGYKMRIVDILITNFHQPQSSLLLLIAAFIGDDWKKMYEHALDNDYRFLSYGDACLLFRQ